MLWVLIKIASLFCGYSLELPRQIDSNEHTQLTFLWRNKQNYPLIIIQNPHLFHCLCLNIKKDLKFWLFFFFFLKFVVCYLEKRYRKTPKNLDTQKIVVITLKFDLCCSTIE